MYMFNMGCIYLDLFSWRRTLGMKDEQQIRFAGEGDQEPGLEPGDVVIVLDEQNHQTFKRAGGDLFMEMELSLTEALCGFQKDVKTLDKRTLLINRKPGELLIFLLGNPQIFMLCRC